MGCLKGGLMIIGGLVLAVFVIAFFGSLGRHAEPTAPPATTTSSTEFKDLPEFVGVPPSSWTVSHSTDAMADGGVTNACAESVNDVAQSFPYKTAPMLLCLRKHPRYGQDVTIRLLGGGQFLCTSYDGCTVRVRFDDGAAQAFSAAEPADHSSDVLFISNDARFIAALKRSKRVTIEASLFQQGAPSAAFENTGLDWPPGSAAAAAARAEAAKARTAAARVAAPDATPAPVPAPEPQPETAATPAATVTTDIRNCASDADCN